ncbi:MAG TPA: hypothetical protein PKA27_09525 [Fimbriimonadaceae bacterium]|nr:hypothetical protein [Fimbriimonadaceae bacterium]
MKTYVLSMIMATLFGIVVVTTLSHFYRYGRSDPSLKLSDLPKVKLVGGHRIEGIPLTSLLIEQEEYERLVAQESIVYVDATSGKAYVGLQRNIRVGVIALLVAALLVASSVRAHMDVLKRSKEHAA